MLPHHYAPLVTLVVILVLSILLINSVSLTAIIFRLYNTAMIANNFSKYTSFETTTFRQNNKVHWFNFNAVKMLQRSLHHTTLIQDKMFGFTSLFDWFRKFMPVFQTIKFPYLMKWTPSTKTYIYNLALKAFQNYSVELSWLKNVCVLTESFCKFFN